MGEIYDWEAEGSFIYNWEQERRDERTDAMVGSGMRRLGGSALCVASIALAAKADIGFLQTANEVHQSGQLNNLFYLAEATLLAWGGFSLRGRSLELREQARELV